MAAPGITVNIRDGIVIVDPSDRKNLCDTEDGLPQLVRSLADEGFRKFVLNLRRVPYIDSTGLGCIARAALTVAHRDGQLKLLNADRKSTRLNSSHVPAARMA